MLDFGTALQAMFNQAQNGARYNDELARIRREEEMRKPALALQAMQAAEAGAFQGPEGLQTLQRFGGGWLPAVNTMGLSPSSPIPPPAATPQAPVNYLQTMPESYGKPTSQNASAPTREPAGKPVTNAKTVAEPTEAQGDIIKIMQAQVVKQLEDLNKEQMSAPPAPKTQEEYFQKRKEALDFLAKKYPQMVDPNTGSMHPYLVHQADQQLQEQMKREQALELKKQGLIQQMILLQGQRGTADVNHQVFTPAANNSGNKDKQNMINQLKEQQKLILSNAGLAAKLEGFDPSKLKNSEQRIRFQNIQQKIDELLGVGQAAPQQMQAPKSPTQPVDRAQQIKADPRFSKKVQQYMKIHSGVSKDVAEKVILDLLMGK